MSPAELVAAVLALGALLEGAAPETIGAALGTRFSLADETPWMQTWRAPGTPPVAGWELRLPRPGASFAGLLTAELARPGLAAADLEPALAGLPPAELELVSPPLDPAAGWLPLAATCHALPAARFCVSWQGEPPARATALSLESLGAR